MSKNKKTILFTICCLFSILSCATSQTPGTRPDDMSHEEHLDAAEKEKLTALKHKEQYDPDMRVQESDKVMRFGHLWGDPSQGNYSTIPGRIYNPTVYHNQLAKKHAKHAKQHEAAAEALDNSKNKECMSIYPQVRHLCPLVGTIKEVETIKEGVRLIIRDDVDTNGVLAHARCHHSFGAYNGYKDMPDCPLYLKGISIKKHTNDSIDIISDDFETAKEVLRRAKTHPILSSN